MDTEPIRIETRTGEHLRVRAIHSADAPNLQRAFALLSERSRYQRFMTGTPALSDNTAGLFSDIDHVNHVALVAFSDPPSQHDVPAAEMVGVARFIRYQGTPDEAELAITVADAWQGKGVGTGLLGLLCDRARAAGIQRFIVEMLADSTAVRALVKAAGGQESPPDGDVVQGYIELARAPQSSLL
jgi:acetyltransferase